MKIKKRGFHKNRGDFFRSKLVLDSLKSKIAFFVIVLMFGVVISIEILDVYGSKEEFEKGSAKLNKKESNVLYSPEVLEGTSEVIHYDDFDNKKSWEDYYLRTNDGTRYKLNFIQGQEPDMISGENIKVTGIANNVASQESEIDVEGLEILQSATAGAEPNPNLGPQRIVVILANFQDNPLQPVTKEEVWNRVFDSYRRGSINSWVQEVSYGKTWLPGDVYGWYTLPSAFCSRENFLDFIDAIVSASDNDIYFGD